MKFSKKLLNVIFILCFILESKIIFKSSQSFWPFAAFFLLCSELVREEKRRYFFQKKNLTGSLWEVHGRVTERNPLKRIRVDLFNAECITTNAQHPFSSREFSTFRVTAFKPIICLFKPSKRIGLEVLESFKVTRVSEPTAQDRVSRFNGLLFEDNNGDAFGRTLSKVSSAGHLQLTKEINNEAFASEI